MEPEILVFMPNGDITLRLIRNIFNDVDTPSEAPTLLSESAQLDAPIAVEEEAVEEEPDENVLFFAPDAPGSENGPSYPPPPRATRGSDASSRRDRSSSPPASFWASLKRQAARVGRPIEDEQPETPPKSADKPERIIVSSHEVHCIVSSRHMMLASHHFETILSGDFDEADTLRAKGHVSIPLSVDLDSMIILLNIIHGASRKVPRQVSLEELRKLATLVSSFGMLETVQFFSDTWVDNLQMGGLPKSYNENVLPLLFVFWVFDRPAEFKDMTRLTQRECDENLDEDVRDIPIPHSIIDAIKRDREFAMETAITVIHALITKYMDGQTTCDGAIDDDLRYACDAMVLGSLMKSSRKIGLWPRPEAPFNGKKFKDLAHAIRNIRILDVCKRTSSRRIVSLGPGSNCHGLEDTIEASMKSIEAGLDGLELSDYPKKSEDVDSIFQSFPLPPSNDELEAPIDEDDKENCPIYMKEEATEAPRTDTEVSKTEYSLLSSKFSPHNDSRDNAGIPKSEVNVYRQEYSPPDPVSPPHTNFMATTGPLREVKIFQREQTTPETKSLISANAKNVEEYVQDEVKFVPGQYSRGFQQPEPLVSPRTNTRELEASIKQEEKTNPRNSPSQELRVPVKSNSPVLDEPTRDEAKILTDRKLNRTTSYPKIPYLAREEVKSPLKEFQVAPRVASIEEIVEEVPMPEMKEVSITRIDAVEALKDASTTTEEEEILAPPQNFKMRKSKKKFSTRF